ncbi:hypothetical protein [Phreatobacter stygius]|uniref:hypothetical protein n=1 Tax=Phreatobacter stygius TaxID=1940610 RepID=UPI001476CD31|nr:hypothetical protein [Phreatobacter stygius]
MKTSTFILSFGATLLALGIVTGALRGTRPIARQIRYELGSSATVARSIDS